MFVQIKLKKIKIAKRKMGGGEGGCQVFADFRLLRGVVETNRGERQGMSVFSVLFSGV